MEKQRCVTLSFVLSLLERNAIAKIVILILLHEWLLRYSICKYPRSKSVHAERKRNVASNFKGQKVSISVLSCCPSFWQQWLLLMSLKLTVKQQWLSRALQLASKEGRIHYVESESDCTASDVVCNHFSSQENSQVSSPSAQRNRGPFSCNLYPFHKTLPVHSIQHDVKESSVSSEGWTFALILQCIQW